MINACKAYVRSCISGEVHRRRRKFRWSFLASGNFFLPSTLFSSESGRVEAYRPEKTGVSEKPRDHSARDIRLRLEKSLVTCKNSREIRWHSLRYVNILCEFILSWSFDAVHKIIIICIALVHKLYKYKAFFLFVIKRRSLQAILALESDYDANKKVSSFSQITCIWKKAGWTPLFKWHHYLSRALFVTLCSRSVSLSM